jgi:hypothetical protein
MYYFQGNVLTIMEVIQSTLVTMATFVSEDFAIMSNLPLQQITNIMKSPLSVQLFLNHPLKTLITCS